MVRGELENKLRAEAEAQAAISVAYQKRDKEAWELKLEKYIAKNVGGSFPPPKKSFAEHMRRILFERCRHIHLSQLGEFELNWKGADKPNTFMQAWSDYTIQAIHVTADDIADETTFMLFKLFIIRCSVCAKQLLRDMGRL